MINCLDFEETCLWIILIPLSSVSGVVIFFIIRETFLEKDELSHPKCQKSLRETLICSIHFLFRNAASNKWQESEQIYETPPWSSNTWETVITWRDKREELKFICRVGGMCNCLENEMKVDLFYNATFPL